jgi:hypothetical protein
VSSSVCDKPPIVVYHIATMGNWREVVRDQLFKLRRCGLAQALADAQDTVRITHVGQHLDVVVEEAARQDVPVTIVRSDENTDHYETFAMMEIERLAKEEKVSRSILYFHTKGVSNPHDHTKHFWRWTMERFVLDRWRENIDILNERDAVGFNWWNFGDEHFSGTFWMARADWIRLLPDFVEFHHEKGLVRYSCELWIGSSKARRCNAYSYGCMGQVTWTGNFDWTWVLPPEPQPSKRITFISAATPSYLGDLVRLQESFKRVGPGFSLLTQVVEPTAWRHCYKLDILRRLLEAADTDHVFWIDSDCEFLCPLLAEDLVQPGKPYTFVRHLAYGDPRTVLPARLHHRLPEQTNDLYWQCCLFGGRKEALLELLDLVEWVHEDERGYDEWAVNIELTRMADKVFTLPCRYAAPSSFQGMPQYQESYEARSGGAARILHHNREINR